MIRRAFIVGSLSVLCLYLAWNFYSGAIGYVPGTPAVPKKDGAMPAETMLPSGGSAWTAAIHEKNLFSPERTYREPKPAPIVSAPPVEPPKRPELALRGIVLDRYGEYVAFVEINKAKAIPLRKGDAAEGIEVTGMNDREVVIKWMTETIPLRMDKIRTIQNPRAGR